MDLDNLNGEKHHLYYLLCEEKKEHGTRPNKSCPSRFNDWRVEKGKQKRQAKLNKEKYCKDEGCIYFTAVYNGDHSAERKRIADNLAEKQAELQKEEEKLKNLGLQRQRCWIERIDKNKSVWKNDRQSTNSLQAQAKINKEIDSKITSSPQVQKNGESRITAQSEQPIEELKIQQSTIQPANNYVCHTFYRTSSAQHKEKVQKIFTKLLAQDDIYLGKYHGSYCVPCEDYIRESKVVNNCCPFCNSPLRTIEEPAYFLRVSKYYANLTTYYEKNPYFLLPSRAKKDLFANFLQNDIRDLCITRSDIEWGIPVPNHKKMVIYVWFEALLNYLNSEAGAFFFTAEFPRETKNSPAPDVATEYLLKKSTAKEIIHLLGKEITRKMSKSKGNVIDPLELLKKYPSDLLKSYLVAKVNFLQDGVFSEELLKGFHQDFFVHNLGNLCSRVGKMVELYNNGLVPDFAESENPYLKKYYQTCLRTIGEYQKLMDNYQLTAAFQEIQTLLDLSNKLIQEIEP
ncbi:6439_t:CDS:2 [Funneliformis geosporum]|uniref:6439_t:CDS:1 n=1 Tax=Funneliformis geosporum TaxID=1117311 RepID=A0A9W4T5P6_9GLOM|nr:6439_t:CDS:2 [Funneliformis geosporum]